VMVMMMMMSKGYLHGPVDVVRMMMVVDDDDDDY